MNDLLDWELPAIDFASDCAGEYLESINETNLELLTSVEWQTLIALICINFMTKRQEIMPCPF